MKINTKLAIKLIGTLAFIEGAFMLPCVCCAVYYDELECAKPFFTVSLLCMCLGIVIKGLISMKRVTAHIRESYLIVLMSWLFCAFIGTIPMYCSGQGYSFINCIFESVAAFSTTGCTVIDVDMVPHSLLLWRAISQWLGGMGILILLISIFPMWGISNQSIASAEMTSAKIDQLESNYSSTGKFLYLAYFTFTNVQFVLLYIGPMDCFTAILTSFSVISTSGLIITNDNQWLFDLAYVRAVVLFFSVLSSLNYVVFFMMVKGKFKAAFKNVEIKLFLQIIVVATAVVTLALRFIGNYNSIWQAFKDGLCQVISFATTTGFSICDYSNWPTLAIFILFFVMICGGCTFSTSGSLKIIRIAVLFKAIKRGMMKHIHPNIVNAVVIDKRVVPAKAVSGIISFSLLFFGMYVICCVLLSFSGLDIETVMATTLGMLSNTGLSFGATGSSGYYGMFDQFSQIIMAFTMLAGRLEMYAVLILFSKSFWKPNRLK